MHNSRPNWITRAQKAVVSFIKGLGNRGEVVIPFIDSVEEGQRPAVSSFITNTGATNEDIANFKSFDEFLAGYKPKTQAVDWTSTLDADHKALVGVKGWKTPADTIKGYSELEKEPYQNIALPYTGFKITFTTILLMGIE